MHVIDGKPEYSGLLVSNMISQEWQNFYSMDKVKKIMEIEYKVENMENCRNIVFATQKQPNIQQKHCFLEYL